MKIFNFSEEVYNEIVSQQRKKELTVLLLNVLLLIISILGTIFGILINDALLRIVSFILIPIFTIKLFYPLFIYFDHRSLAYETRCYVINENQFFYINFTDCVSYNKILSFINTKVITNESKNEDEEFGESDIWECYEFIKVNKITEYNDRYEVICDSKNIITDKIKLHDKFLIYKYVKDYEQIKAFLLNK